MRILHVVSGLDRRAGGVTAAVVGLAESQRRAGMVPTVLSTFAPGADNALADRLRASGVTVELIGPLSPRRLFSHRALKQALNRLLVETDIVHVHGLWEIVQHQAAESARARRVPYIVTPHGMLSTWAINHRGLKKRIYLRLRLRKTLNRAAALHFTTREECRQTIAIGLHADTFVAPLGVHLREFATLPPAGSFREKFLPGRPERVLLFMGRLHRVKALDLLIPAFELASLENTILVIAGPDDAGYGDVVRQMVRANGLDDRVVFTGMLVGDDRIAALADADLFVLPSYQENFGVVVLEAMAAGTPVIVSDKVNLAELIAGRGVGEVVPCEVAPIAAALSRWMKDDAMRTQAGAVARPLTLAEFDWDRIAPHWKDHYGRFVRSADRDNRP